MVIFVFFVTLGIVEVVVVVDVVDVVLAFGLRLVPGVVVVVVVVAGLVVVVVVVAGAVVVVGTAVTANDLVVAVAAPNPPPEVMDAPMVQLPASRKVTTPLDVLTVQILVVELENDFVPDPTPADGVAVIVGGVSEITYGPESPLRLSVRDVAVTVKLLDVAVAAAYPLAAVIDELMVHVPASTKATRPLEELTVQILVVELENDLVPELFPADAVADIVGGVAVIA